MVTDFEKRYIEARRALVSSDYAKLNDKQREAVLATEGPLLILAGAGSGKTTVLINRIANLLKYGRASDSEDVPAGAAEEDIKKMQDGGEEGRRIAALDPVEPWRILAITFTNKAAGELKARLENMLGPEGAATSGPAPSTPPASASCGATRRSSASRPTFSIYDTCRQPRAL